MHFFMVCNFENFLNKIYLGENEFIRIKQVFHHKTLRVKFDNICKEESKVVNSLHESAATVKCLRANKKQFADLQWITIIQISWT